MHGPPNEPERRIPMLVVCAGLPRSGSTWVYNAARLILERAGEGAVLGAWIDDLDPSGDAARTARHLVVKTHAYDAALASSADAVLCTHRDLGEIAASMRRVGFAADEDDALDSIGAALEHARRWEAHAARSFSYDEIVSAPIRTVSRIARALSIELDAQGARGIECTIPRDTPRGDAYDPVTLLHPNHTGGAGPRRVSARCDAILRERHADWRRDHGYA